MAASLSCDARFVLLCFENMTFSINSNQVTAAWCVCVDEWLTSDIV